MVLQMADILILSFTDYILERLKGLSYVYWFL